MVAQAASVGSTGIAGMPGAGAQAAAGMKPPDDRARPMPPPLEASPCPTCHETGLVERRPCPTCGASGRLVPAVAFR